jgi:hypothetical protein
MGPSEQRYEWRVWGESLGDIAARMASLSECHGTRHCLETYFVSTATDDANPKVRADLLDVKVLREVRDGFERWEPVLKAAFPVTAAFLRDDLFPALGVASPPLERAVYTLAQLRDEVVAPHGAVAAIGVHKRRSAYTINGCIAEVADVTIDDRRLQTAVVESADLGALREARILAGLDALANVNYPRAIKQMLGWGVSTASGARHDG